MKLKTLPTLAFVPEHEVVYCFNLLIQDFHESARDVAIYFENTYIGERMFDQTRRIPPFPIRIWTMYERIRIKLVKTNNSVEGWHNAIKSSISSLHLSFVKFLKFLQREQTFQEAKVAKWEVGSVGANRRKAVTPCFGLLQ